MVVEASAREFNFMDAVDIHDIFEMDDMILGVFVDRNVSLLNASAEGFDNVAVVADEKRDVVRSWSAR